MRIIKARIRTVYIGIQDPHFTVDGRGKEFLEQSGVKVEVFPRKFQEEIEAANADFRTRCNEEKSKKGREPASSSLDTSAPNVQWSDFSVDALREFHDLAKLPEDFQSDDFTHKKPETLTIHGSQTKNRSANPKVWRSVADSILPAE
jgi:hypothetical protein